MELLDVFYSPNTIDCHTFVFDLRNPWNGYYTMLATSEDGFAFSQWTEGLYEREKDNPHLGKRVLWSQLGTTLVSHVLGRLEE